MLNSVEVSAFVRIPYLKLKLDDARVHVLCGPNEAGKSSLAEAIRFAYRGLSTLVEKKAAFGELINSGKRSGYVELVQDGFPIRRNIRDAKVQTKLPLDYPPLLVDIQLGGIEFALAKPSALREMLNEVFKVGTQDEFIRARLKAKGVTDDMMRRTLPLIRASGFEGAAKAAKDEQSRARGEWEGITRETYGSVKAQNWRPEILNEPEPSHEEIQRLESEIKSLKEQRDEKNRRLGAIAEALQLQAEGGEASIEELENALREAEETHAGNEAALRTAQEDYRTTVEEIEEEIRTLERKLQIARQAAATLDCPRCGAKLNIKVQEDTPVLVNAEKPAECDEDVRTITASLSQHRKALETTRRDQEAIVDSLLQALTESQTALVKAQTALESRRAAAARPVATQEEAEEIAAEIGALDQKIASAESRLQDLKEQQNAREQAERDTDRAAKAAHDAAQWAILAEALGSGPNGIPAELVAATTKPLNAELAKIALSWDTTPAVMGADMSLSRADGTPYYLLSAAAKWKVNAMMQLALATVSPLKLVVLDGFDVIQPADRGAFIDALADYTERYPDITVIAMGTLKARPVEQIDGMRFHWIENGQLQEAA